MELLCIIIEDEPLATRKLESFINDTPFLHLVKSFEEPLEGMNYLKNNPVDLLFLDIQMEKLTGIQLLETLSVKPYVIITSAYSEYALKGYELSVSDYLLKPYSFERFLLAVNKIHDLVQSNTKKSNDSEYIFIKTEYRYENVLVKNILYIEGMREYLRICLPDKKIMTKMSFKSLLEQLPGDKFVQVHKSWAVAIPHIETIERSRIKIGQAIIPIGDSFKEKFREIIGKKGKD